jgi:integrase/recombinase XerD
MTAAIMTTDAAGSGLAAWWSAQVEDYLRLRRSLGFGLVWDEQLLGKFTADLASRDVRVVTVADAIAWSLALPPGQIHRPLTRAPVRLTAIRGFATYLYSLDPAHEIPPREVFGWRKTRPAPYIYADDEVRALLEACASMIRYGRRDLYPVLFGLIAATGLRLGEALGLSVEEADLENGILAITRGKSRDPRLVRLHPTTTEALRDYADKIAPTRRGDRGAQTSGSSGGGARFFSLPGGGPLPPCNVHHAFREVTTRIGLRTETVWPRIHDLRHTFAVNTLLGWYRDGRDVAAMMPVLSTYLGHTKPANTYWYLTATPELLGLAAQRLAISEAGE